MSYTPFSRWRNFTIENLKTMLALYPDLLTGMRRESVADQIEESFPGYKRTAYQFGCQLGIESRADYFTSQNYLNFLDDEGLKKYLGFWFKMYVCPNPYVNSDDAPCSPFAEIASRVLASPEHEISYTEVCNDLFGEGKSMDIFKNALTSWGRPLSVSGDTISVAPEEVEELEKCLEKVNATLPMRNNKDADEFFSRFSCEKFMYFYEMVSAYEYDRRFSDGTNAAAEEETDTLPVLSGRRRVRFPLNCILYGTPGTGKTWATAQYAIAIVENRSLADVAAEERSAVMARYNRLINERQIVFTTFHQSYGYEDFIQGIRPDTSGKALAFKTVDGVFKAIVDRAMHAPEKDFVIIIDEINRANISKVFGELITLIEEDKRWGEENAVCASLPSGEIFAVPNNLYIVGTMNSADKSISLIDTALRRRFEFIEHVPNLQLVSDPQLRTVLERLNSGIADELSSTDLLIGHSYFMGRTADDICDIMNRSIIPLLYEYFLDNGKKVEAQVKRAVEGLDVEVRGGRLGRVRLVKRNAE